MERLTAEEKILVATALLLLRDFQSEDDPEQKAFSLALKLSKKLAYPYYTWKGYRMVLISSLRVLNRNA